MNPKLKAHLEAMATRLAPDCDWLVPSPQRGDKNIPAKTFRESPKLARTHAASKEREQAENQKMAGVAFHDMRHHFISYAVMSGIDFMTIAACVAHQDGGVLIGRVYGHLADAHKKQQAQRLTFGPGPVDTAARHCCVQTTMKPPRVHLPEAEWNFENLPDEEVTPCFLYEFGGSWRKKVSAGRN